MTEGAVSQWIKKAKAGGTEALRHQPPPGPQPRLNEAQRAQLPDLLAKGAEHYGFRGEVWTTARVAGLIKEQFGVTYHPAHCSRLLRAVRHSVQKPVELATQRNEQAIGALTPEGRLFMQTQDHSYKGEHVVGFLKQLLRHIPGKLLIIWDGSPIHHCQAIKDFLAAGTAARIHLERLPAYAPELNPQEGVWNLLKRRELKNVWCKDLSQLDSQLLQARARLRHRKYTLRHCFAHAGYCSNSP